ncbi:hypothetical protein ASPACDRAFT_41205 [Aspergillus aculeatus ATCC 16872]|uniref:Yeast cell wall synthesis Kre9/Knh1-like N-terminal domain-containing protein n=1 Tax=Aspergillus aculeatus (strain ATCC 16872 / CBS 172.66 / WB 5094) TaxID=690307 RepID=A0A1L9X1R7_ASPA1|nr:uncharacterized protein ASPACDRAFT_41205 [Aspergillus aculeatus ATCC 16872]OJK02381.1 hypothetical protein ASPACDRAFT_41205 [Aspergillus aculeatus ATCC 16872]
MRSLSLLLAIVAFAASALALTITAPKAGDQVDFSKSYKFQWTTVSSDPDEVTLVLVNMASQPTVNKVITQNAKVSDGSYTVDMITGIPVANGYQLNAIANTTQNTGILSQSNQFNVTKVGKVETGKDTSNSTLSSPPSHISQSAPTSPTSPTPTPTPSSPLSSPAHAHAPLSSSTYTSTRYKARPCIYHKTSSPSSPSSSTIPSASVRPATASATTATKTAASATASAGAAASAMTLSGPLAVLSALVMSIFAGAL